MWVLLLVNLCVKFFIGGRIVGCVGFFVGEGSICMMLRRMGIRG